MSQECPTCTGERGPILEDIPSNALVKAPPNAVPIETWHMELIRDVMLRFGRREMSLPRLVRLRPRTRGVFGGRLLVEGTGMGLFAHPDRTIERATLLHELAHYLGVYEGDILGKHDERFFDRLEPIYRHYGVSLDAARIIEGGAVPAKWKW